MNTAQFGSVSERLDADHFDSDEQESHIAVDQAAVTATGAGPLLVRICPAHVYSMHADGSLGVTYRACLECGTCRALAPAGVLRWHYPRGGLGVSYREG